MILQNLANPDSLKAVQDSIAHAKESQVLQNIGFDPSKILDGNGIIISVAGYVVVFLSLLLLYLIFANLTKVLQLRLRKKLKSEGHKEEAEEKELSVSGEINAAISMALYLHFEEAHDIENTVLTITKVQRTYSPWSSKIYGLREFPKK